MAIYYKFKSARDYDTIAMDGPFISVGILKDKIFETKHLGTGKDLDIVVSNAQTNEEYLDEAMLIPKNTSVLIRRVPGRPRITVITTQEPRIQNKVEDVQAETTNFPVADPSAAEFPEDEYDEFGTDLYSIPDTQDAQHIIPRPHLATADDKVDEESKIQALIDTPALDWQQRQGQDTFGAGRGYGRGMPGRMNGRGFGMERKTPPPGYVCHRCNIPGHFIQHCPTNGDPNYDVKRVKPPTGIPKSMLMATPDGSYSLPSGAVAVLKPNEDAFEKEMEGLPSTTRSVGELPPELKCPLCKEVMKDAALTLKVIAFSENTQEMLGLIPHTVPSMEQREALTIGTDVKSLFLSPGCSALEKAVDFGEISILNPITLHCRSSSKPFYAILHRIEEGLVIDLEPVSPDEVPVTAAGALRSYKLAAKSISRLQALPSGNMLLLCDALVKEVSELTGYDRVMVYKFHEDGHGEVIAECCREDMEPYLGLHYSATDIPQASRFLFMRNKVRMICDCSAVPVKVVQDKSLSQPISLSGSTLRAPHGCHAQYMSNMGSVASLVMSVTINGSDSDEMNRDLQTGRHLWGLVVCHHASPRFVPFPLRYACEFLTQVFGVQINKEAESAVLLKEKRILQTQSVLCDMLFRNAPIGIVTQSPNIMDLVKCDGAALYYRDNLWSLGVTPTETQIRDLIDWVLKSHGGNTGFTTESLMESGYPDASVLGESICGMAAVYISEKDFLFWFRSSTAKQIKWGGARHDPNDRDGKRMHPRSSFKAFMEIVRWKSVPWDDMEMDAINSLQLIIKGSLQEEHSKTVVDVPLVDNRVQKVDELCVIVNEMVRLIDTAAVPIFAVDASGVINGWNSKAAEVTGLAVEQAIGKPVSDLVEDDSVETVKNMLALALEGSEERGAEIRIRAFGPKRKSSPVELVVNTCCSRDMTNNVLGVCFIGQDVTGQKTLTENYSRVKGDYARIMWSPSTLIPPIFITNENGVCSEWNNAMQKLSGIKREEVVNKILLGEVFTTDDYGCCLKDHDTLTKLRIGFNAVISGQKNIEKLLFGFYHRDGSFIEALLSANKRTDIEGKVTGVLCFLQVPSPELQYALQVQQISEHAIACALNKLAYLRHEVKDPEKAISFLQDLLHSSGLSEDQKRLLRTSVLCREQLAKVISDSDIEGIEEGYVELDCSEFGLQESLEAVVKQVMELSIERKVQISCDYPQEVSSMRLYGDNLRLQQILSETLLSSIRFTPALRGLCVSFKVIARIEAIGKRMKRVELEFRIIHPAPGLPEDLVREMFQPLRKGTSREGLGLHITQKLVKLMERGTLRYLRESEMSAFVILTEFPLI